MSLLESLDTSKRSAKPRSATHNFSENHPFYGLFKLVDVSSQAGTSSSSQSQAPSQQDSQAASRPLSQSARQLLGRPSPQRESSDILTALNADFLAAVSDTRPPPHTLDPKEARTPTVHSTS